MAELVRIEHSHPEHNEWFVINWCLGNTCTYSCSYCPSDLHNGTSPWPDKHRVMEFIHRMALHADALGKRLYVELTGGEVTVWKDFLEVAEFCQSIDVKLGFISNGSRSVRWWEENKYLFDHVCLSYHPEEADPEHFVQVVKTVAQDLRTHVNIMMKPEMFNKCLEVAHKVKNVGNISIALQPLIVDFGDKLYEYTESQNKIFEAQHELFVKHIKWTKGFPFYRGAMRSVNSDGTSEVKAAHRYIAQGENNWSGWSCYSGVEQLVVDMGGNIRRGWCMVGESLGTIYEPKLTTQPVVCTKTMCHCNYDIMSTKVKRPGSAQPYRVVPIIAEK